jgi:DNA replication and repair protein RecF
MPDMNIISLHLRNFRNYQDREFNFGNQSIIVGQNGVGKSNILEAVYLLAVGKSFRADRDHEMIRHNESFAQIEAVINDLNLKITIAERKKFEVNGVPRRMQDFLDHTRAVLFTPSDMDLVTGSPGSRRKYLDFVISQADRDYRRSLISYEKGIRQRNKLLERIREGTASRNQLFFWDRLLIKNGDYITRIRGEYLDELGNNNYQATYDKSIISEERIVQYEKEEVAAASTLVGPHRDDFVIFAENKNVAKYGSRGEQRMAMLWLKMGELKYLTQENQLPILLLDDIFSELDHRHREEVFQIVALHQLAGGQTILTSADEHLLPQFEGGNVIKL